MSDNGTELQAKARKVIDEICDAHFVAGEYGGFSAIGRDRATEALVDFAKACIRQAIEP